MIKFQIFVASPSDVIEERELISEIVAQEIRRIFRVQNQIFKGEQFDINVIRWEKDTIPDVGEDAQDVINKQVGEFDVFIGIMWKRFGTPTGRALSGTSEEFERAFNSYKKYNRPKIMFYFRTTAFYPRTSDEISQLGKVIEFKEKIKDLGVIYGEYENPLQFEREVREHLIKQLFLLLDSKLKTEQVVPIEKDNKVIVAEKKKTKVFISYGREDEKHALKLYQGLKNIGAEPWLDSENLLPGQNWKTVISKAIRECDYFIALLSANSIGKKGFVQKEVKYALDLLSEMPNSEIFIIPVRLDECTPEDERLIQLHWVNMYPSWSDGFNKILKTIEKKNIN